MSNDKRITKVQWSLATLLLSQVILLGGCEDPADLDEIIDDEEAVDPEDDEFRVWTGYTSEEYPPLICPQGQAVRGVDCNGGYCDNVSLYCQNTGRSTGWQSWQPYFSEEGSGWADESHCPSGDMWVTGVACHGGYCDNLSLQCTQFIGSSTGSCAWSTWYSEEQAPFIAPWGYYIHGIECDGGYCDNKRYYYCWMN
jgi:hypothetical protein